jgi:hypothetical protein
VSDIVSIALISASSAIVAPALLSYLNGRQLKAKEMRDYARQDQVSERVEALRIEAARHAHDTVQAVVAMSENIEKIEKATNSMMAEAQRIALEKADADAALARAAGVAEGVALRENKGDT